MRLYDFLSSLRYMAAFLQSNRLEETLQPVLVALYIIELPHRLEQLCLSFRHGERNCCTFVIVPAQCISGCRKSQSSLRWRQTQFSEAGWIACGYNKRTYSAVAPFAINNGCSVLPLSVPSTSAPCAFVTCFFLPKKRSIAAAICNALHEKDRR